MPRKALFTKEEIVAKALGLVRKNGHVALTARELGKALGSSARPIFTVFKNMDEVGEEVKKAAQQAFSDYIASATEYTPAFKEYGMRIIRFAREENNLFRYLFLQKGSNSDGAQFIAQECFNEYETEYELSKKEVATMFSQMWVFTCGLAVLCTGQPNVYTEELASEMITRQFVATISLIKSGRKFKNIKPHPRAKGEKNIIKLDSSNKKTNKK